MLYLLLILLFLVFGFACWFVSSRLSDLFARLDYLSGVVDYLCTSLGRPDMSQISEDLEAVLAYCEDVPEDSGLDDVSSDDGSKENVQC